MSTKFNGIHTHLKSTSLLYWLILRLSVGGCSLYSFCIKWLYVTPAPPPTHTQTHSPTHSPTVPSHWHCSPGSRYGGVDLHPGKRRRARETSRPHLWGWGRSHPRHVQHRQGKIVQRQNCLIFSSNNSIVSKTSVSEWPCHNSIIIINPCRVSLTSLIAPSSMLYRKAGLSTWGNVNIDRYIIIIPCKRHNYCTCVHSFLAASVWSFMTMLWGFSFSLLTSTKNTILKKYDGRFKDIFEEIYTKWVICFIIPRYPLLNS